MMSARIMGPVLLAVGIVLLIMGYNASQSISEQAMETITGRFTERTTWFFILGTASTVGGLVMLGMGRGKQ